MPDLPRTSLWTLWICLPMVALGFVGLALAEPAEKYPLSPEMVLLERDVGAAEYRKILEDMISTELAAEWQRAVNPDDASTFAAKRGGKEKVLADKELAAAYERRDKIVTKYLELVRAEYARRKLPAPFDKGASAMVVPTARGDAKGDHRIELVHPSPEAAAQWYRWRGPDGQGHAASSKAPVRWSATENVVWRTPLPGHGNSSPVIWDDRIFLTSASEDSLTRSVLCLNRYDGKLLWKQDVKLDKLERSVQSKNGYASATPTTDGERVIAFLGNGGMVAYDLDGKQLWRTDLGPLDGVHGPGASPMLYKDVVALVQDQNPGPSLRVALDKRTGKVRWRSDAGKAMGWCTPVVFRIDGRDEMLYTSNERLISCDPLTGKEYWVCDGPTREPVPSIIAGHGLLYCTSGRNGPTLAVRPGGSGNITESHLVWTAVRGGPHVPSPVLVDDLVYFVNDRAIVTCLEALTGKTVYQKRLEGKFSASPVAAAGLIFFNSEEGDTFVVKAGRQFEVVAVNRLGEPTLASLAILDDRVYVRTSTSLLCIGTR